MNSLREISPLWVSRDDRADKIKSLWILLQEFKIFKLKQYFGLCILFKIFIIKYSKWNNNKFFEYVQINLLSYIICFIGYRIIYNLQECFYVFVTFK